MKRCLIAVSVLMISFCVSACSGKSASSALFTTGGMVSGLTGTLVLQNNGGDDLTITTDGPFTFPTGIAPGSSYTVTVRTNPSGQTCTVSNGTGTILISSITNVTVNCFERGELDIAFNSPDGFLVQNNVVGGNAEDFGKDLVIDSRGRILVAGSSRNSAGNLDMVVWRYNPDGTLDPEFGGDGIISASSGTGNASGKGIAVDSLDRILVTGSTTTVAGDTDMAIWRFRSDGTLDTEFGNNGLISAPVGTGDDSGNAIAVDTLDRILVTGSTTTIAGTTDMVVWRFNENGTVDKSFSNDGMVVHNNAANGNSDDAGNDIAVDSQGRIVVTGSSRNSAGNMDVVIWRIKDYDGTFDTQFGGGDGIAVHNASGNGDDFGNAVAVDALGRILVTGSSRNSADVDTDLLVSRFTTTGLIDTAFNGTGTIINNGAAGSNGDDSGSSLTIDNQGRILVTGSSRNAAGNLDMVLWRFTSNGSLDVTFGSGGIVVHNSAALGNGDDFGAAVITDSENRIIVTGSSSNVDGNSDMALWRLYP